MATGKDRLGSPAWTAGSLQTGSQANHTVLITTIITIIIMFARLTAVVSSNDNNDDDDVVDVWIYWSLPWVLIESVSLFNYVASGCWAKLLDGGESSSKNCIIKPQFRQHNCLW